MKHLVVYMDDSEFCDNPLEKYFEIKGIPSEYRVEDFSWHILQEFDTVIVTSKYDDPGLEELYSNSKFFNVNRLIRNRIEVFNNKINSNITMTPILRHRGTSILPPDHQMFFAKFHNRENMKEFAKHRLKNSEAILFTTTKYSLEYLYREGLLKELKLTEHDSGLIEY